MSHTYRLIYFNSKGLAEVTRLMFALAGVEYEDVRISKEDWPQIKPSTLTGTLPVLEIDGKPYCQSNAFNRYLAKQFDLYGKTQLEELKVDMIVDIMMDFLKPLSGIYGVEDGEEKTAAIKKYEDEQIPTILASLEKILMANNDGGGYFVGQEKTWADLAFFHYVQLPSAFGVVLDWTKTPKLKALHERVAGLPKIAEWIARRPESSRQPHN